MPSTPVNQSICVECGAPLSPRASEGLCRRCLLESGVHILNELDSQDLTRPAGAVVAAAARNTTTGTVSNDSGSSRVFGDYELLDEIARGGMGIVFRARQMSLNRIVAVKMLKFGEFTRNEFVTRFQAEAEAAATLHHPNIVAIYDCGECVGERYYSMELIEGKNLGEWVQGQPLDARRAAALICTIAAAVQHAHDRGILHRDLKPSNILLDHENEPHVSDFGLARRIDDNSSLTLTGQTLGSPNYMAPEQAAGARERVGVKSDIWSLGAIFYYLLTARPPFAGPTMVETLRALQQDDPAPPRLLNSAVPADLETICLKCLEKEPRKRYVTAQELADDLARFLRSEPILARPITRVERAWQWCRRKPGLASSLGAAAALLLAILIGSPIAIYRINHALLKARQFAYASDMNLAQQAVNDDDFYRALQLLERHRPPSSRSRSGQHDEVQSSPGGTQSLVTSAATDLRSWEWRYLWNYCRAEERYILGEHTDGASAVGMLADGKTVFSAGNDKLVRLWDMESRRPIGLLRHSEKVIGAAASRDGRWLATATEKLYMGQPVLLWDLATQKIAATLTTNFWLRPGSITFSPDNKWLALGTMWGGIRIWDVDARREVTHLLASGPSPESRGLAFSPDSRTLAYNEDDDGAIVLWDIGSRSVTGHLTGHQSAVTALAFSPDGQILAAASQDRTTRVWNVPEQREWFGFTNYSSWSCRLAFSPDGRTLAMTGAGAGRVIRLVDIQTRSGITELRGHLKGITSLNFTPDGHLLLSASDDGTLRVWDVAPRSKEKSAHSFAQKSICTEWNTYGPALCLSPDGRHLLTVYSNHTFSVWDTLRLVEGKRHPLPFTNSWSASMANGGRLAAFGNTRGEFMVWDVELAQPRFLARPVTNRIHRLAFSSDGRHLAVANVSRPFAPDGSYLPALPGSTTVRVWDLASQKETHVFSKDLEIPWSLAFSSNAVKLLAGSRSGSVNLWPLSSPGEPATFRGHSEVAGSPALLPDGKTLISSAGDIRFWDVRTGRQTDQLSPRLGMFCGIALSPDGRRFAAGASDGRITIWDVASHQEVATLEGHEESVMQLAFTPDGDHLVSVSNDQLRIWRAASFAETDKN